MCEIERERTDECVRERDSGEEIKEEREKGKREREREREIFLKFFLGNNNDNKI